MHVRVGTYLHAAQHRVVYTAHSSHGGALHPDLHRLQTTTTTRLNALLPDGDLETQSRHTGGPQGVGLHYRCQSVIDYAHPVSPSRGEKPGRGRDQFNLRLTIIK